MKTLRVTRVFRELWKNQKRINALRGGARSSKTYSALQAIALWLLSGMFGSRRYPRGSFSIVRETLPSLRASAYQDFIQILHDLGVYEQIDHRKTELEFRYGDRRVRFFSTDDLNSAKLRGQQHTFFYMNEANTISQEAFRQLIMRTEEFCILDYNPAGDPDNWVRNYIEGTRLQQGAVNLIVSTYKDNIQNLPPEMIKEIENFKHTDPDIYEVYTLGNWVASRSTVFTGVKTVRRMPHNYDREYYGIDFGWNDPTVCVRVVTKNQAIYIEQLFHSPQMTLDEVAHRLRHIKQPIYQDHAPRTRKELKSKGVRVRNAYKAKDSIFQGLQFIRQHQIYILETSLETIKEFRSYKYKTDRDGKVTDIPLDYNNHSVDATRYALSKAIRHKILKQ